MLGRDTCLGARSIATGGCFSVAWLCRIGGALKDGAGVGAPKFDIGVGAPTVDPGVDASKLSAGVGAKVGTGVGVALKRFGPPTSRIGSSPV